MKILSSGLELNEFSGNNIKIDKNINHKNEAQNNNEDSTDNNELNSSNNNIINSKKKKLNGIRRGSFINALNESNSLGYNIADNIENLKDQKNYHNNSEFINEGDTILEENASEASSKNKNKNNEEESEKNYKSFLE